MTTDHSLAAEDLTLAYGERTVIEGLDLDRRGRVASRRSWARTPAASRRCSGR